jgi:hypothetical protein
MKNIITMKKIIFLSILISFLSCKKAEDNKTEDNVPQALEEKVTTAQKIAVLDTKDEFVIDVNDSRVKEIQQHLSSLSDTFNESEDKIANSIFIIHKKFNEEGLNYSNIELLRIADKNKATYKETGISFEEFMAMIFALTEK